MQEGAGEGRCRYCGVAVEQPRSGSRQKLFCSDEHRLRYWRERRKQGLPTGEEAEERQADVRTLTWELQATLQGFERTVEALSRALAEAGDLDAARAVREQVEAETQRRVATADERRARAERLRLEAEALAEAAEAEVHEAHGRLREMEARVHQAETEVEAVGRREQAVRQRLEEDMSAVRRAAEQDVARARAEAQVAVGASEAEVRRVTEVLEGIRGRLQILDRELEEQRKRSAALEQRLQETEVDSRARTARHVSQVEALQAQVRDAQSALAAERAARLQAEERAQAAVALADERARERDRLLEAGGRRPVRRRRARPRASAG